MYTQAQLEKGELRQIYKNVFPLTARFRTATPADIAEVEARKQWEEANPELALLTYNELVEKYIRENYSLSKELEMNRQRLTKSDEYETYFNHCEASIKLAKQAFGIK